MQKEKELIRKGLLYLEIDPKDELIDSFIVFLQELKRWNRVCNLTKITKNEDIIIKHFFDSLLYLRFIPPREWEICDIGSGGGFPGIPIALVRTESQIALIEPSYKKTTFLKHVRRTLALHNVKIYDIRVEDIKGQLFDIATVRALYKIYELIPKVGHILKPGGFYILNKGPAYEKELKEIPPGLHYEVIQIDLPLTKIKRNLIKIYK
ncbi:MAG: 16S rRNA (guanine(527)-N(7))-methyltransferase RsmG [Thermodesulfovibrionales bacterium]|nr:16S rRNA (guanine(527)-N(7))-methyltransferase RsmG [Thermodesulfovibrionales bacterium]